MALETPVITSISRDQWRRYSQFMKRLQKDNSVVAGLEVERLKPYLEAFSNQIRIDIGQAGAGLDAEKKQRLEKMADPDELGKLFKRVAAETRNTVLSEIMLAPDNVFNTLRGKHDTKFVGRYEYEGLKYAFGFIQAFEDEKKHSVSVPVFAFDQSMLKMIEPHKPEAMLRAFQAIMTAGNHDMQHHYTNVTLNSNISASRHPSALPEQPFAVKQWYDKHFSLGGGDTAETSYESWLMLNHERIQKAMEKGPEEEKLRKACDTFFDELERISGKISGTVPAKSVHEMSDYFGTMLLYSMMRYLRLDHPLLGHALGRLEKADPWAGRLVQKQMSVLEEVEKTKDSGDNHPYGVDQKEVIENLAANYKAEGVDLMPDNPDYAALKKLQMIVMAPWVVRLLSRGQRTSMLETMQERVAGVSLDMVDAAAHQGWHSAVDGRQVYKNKDGDVFEAYFKNGRLDRDDGPALVKIHPSGDRKEWWLKDGWPCRVDGGPNYIESRKDTRCEKWLNKEGKSDSQNGRPSEVFTSSDGTIEERYHRNGELHREEGPVQVKLMANGSYSERWCKNGKEHRDDGPSYIRIMSDGERFEIFFKEGVPRKSQEGPTQITTYADGRRIEEWCDRFGYVGRDDGPARIDTRPDGTKISEWRGSSNLGDNPDYVEERPDGSRLERWQSFRSRKDKKPNWVETHADGTRVEAWFDFDNLEKYAVTKPGEKPVTVECKLEVQASMPLLEAIKKARLIEAEKLQAQSPKL